MRKLLTSYSSYFNVKHKRTGKLFEGAFKATHVDNDQYLNYLYAYIHLNPIKIDNPDGWPDKVVANSHLAKQFLEHYKYSSYHEHLGRQRQEQAILTPSAFPEYFRTPREFQDFLDDWMHYSPLGGVTSQ